MFYVVPNSLRDAIQHKISLGFGGWMHCDADREPLYHALLEYFAEHGVIPEFDVFPPDGMDRQAREAREAP